MMKYTKENMKRMTRKEQAALIKKYSRVFDKVLEKDAELNKVFEQEPEFVSEFFWIILVKFSEFEFIMPNVQTFEKVNWGKVFEIFLPGFYSDEEIKDYIDYQIEFFLNNFGHIEAHSLLEFLFGINDINDAPKFVKLFCNRFFDCGTDKIIAEK